MADIFVWIKNNTVLVNFSAVAYLRFGDESGSTLENQPGIVFRVSEGQREEIISLEPEEANRLHDILRQHFSLGFVRQGFGSHKG